MDTQTFTQNPKLLSRSFAQSGLINSLGWLILGGIIWFRLAYDQNQTWLTSPISLSCLTCLWLLPPLTLWLVNWHIATNYTSLTLTLTEIVLDNRLTIPYDQLKTAYFMGPDTLMIVTQSQKIVVRGYAELPEITQRLSTLITIHPYNQNKYLPLLVWFLVWGVFALFPWDFARMALGVLSLLNSWFTYRSPLHTTKTRYFLAILYLLGGLILLIGLALFYNPHH